DEGGSADVDLGAGKALSFLERMKDPVAGREARDEFRQILRDVGAKKIPMERTERREVGGRDAQIADLEASKTEMPVRGYTVSIINDSKIRNISKKTRQEAMRFANNAVQRGAEKAEIWEARRDG